MKQIVLLMSMVLAFGIESMSAQTLADGFNTRRQWKSEAVSTADSKLGPVDNYGFLHAPNGDTWTYVASYERTNAGNYTAVRLEVFDTKKKVVGVIVDNLQLDDETVTGINQAEINPLVTQKFFNNDDQYEVMLFLHAQTTDYEGRYFNHVFSIGTGDTVSTPSTIVEGRQVYAQNVGDFTENYVMIFARDSARNSTNYTLCYDIRRKHVYGDQVHHTFRVPYANVAALTDLQPIFMFKNGKQLNYVLQQYEKPYFDTSVPLDQDPVVTPDNNLVITYINQVFDTLYTTKVPVVQDANSKLLYTFPSIGMLNGMEDIVLHHNGGEAPAYVVTMEKYNLESDGSLCSFYMYDATGQEIGTIAENTVGRLMMSPVAGCEKQWLFLKDVDEGKYLFVDVPSCKKVLEMSIYMEDGSVLSQNIDRVPAGDSYQYVAALLQGDSQDDGTVVQRIAWIKTDGKLDHYDNVNLGKYIEAANVNIDASVLSPWLFNTDDEREYMVLVKRYNPDKTTDKETALLICNTKGEILLDYGKSQELGGDINMVYVVDSPTGSKLVCVYTNGDNLTLNYTNLPLNTSSLKGTGTAEDPYQLASSSDFMLISQNPSAHYAVVNDIDFLNAPFASVRGEFSGVLDGKGHVLRNLLLNGGGLFSMMRDSVVVKDVKFKNPTMVLTEKDINSAGILANMMQGGITDDGAQIDATLSGIHMDHPIIKAPGYKGIVGGLIGEAALFLDIHTCSAFNAELYAPTAQVGGLVGKLATGSKIHATAFSGAIEGGTMVGGIAGDIAGDTPVFDCHVDADLQGDNTIGGVVGFSARAAVHHNYAEGTLTLNTTATTGKVGGIIGEIETDAVGMDSSIVLNNCLVGISAITVPEGKDVIAHRVVGFTSANNYEYDWDNIDWNQPQSEWPRLYYGAEKFIQNNYVVSDLALLDESIAAADSTTEGATLAAAQMTKEWLTEQGFAFGENMAEPWVLDEDGLHVWIEGLEIADGVDNIVIGEDITVEDGILNANGDVAVYTINGMLVLQGHDTVNIATLGQGIYIVTVTNNAHRAALKVMIP